MTDVEEDLRRGIATEHTYRPALKALLEAAADEIVALNDPARIECGAPDFRVGQDRPDGFVAIGHVEAKDVGTSLSSASGSEQLRRYRSALPNLILTDYLTFWWYVEGERREPVHLARATSDGLELVEGGSEDLERMLELFVERRPPAVTSAAELARRMARLTALVHDLIVGAFEEGQATGTLRGIRQAFEEVLLPDLSTSEFADMYAQTMTYALFTARVHHEGGTFRREGAASEIPQTNPFLRRLFDTITGPDFAEEAYAPYVADLVHLLGEADIDHVLADFGQATRREDPVVHFYETFLEEYDPALRERRGVYYTPEPIVNWIVGSVNVTLREHFGCPDGLADEQTITYGPDEETVPRVLILDPACGTGTFLYTIVDEIRQRFMDRGDDGRWSGYVREQLLRRLYGFELLAAPYAIAHLKLGLQLAGRDLPEEDQDRWAYDFNSEERLSIYLTNTLEEATRRSDLLMGQFISEEANAATEVKQDLPVLAVVGNPPYSNFGQMNQNDWIMGLLDAYKEGLDERKLNLDDDFIKFLRWGEWRVNQTGQGMLGFITNHVYLDGLVHRRMREHLMETFDEIYVLDLHGNLRAGEQPPEGGTEENVFGIQQGVAISLYVRYPEPTGDRASVYHAELWGRRAAKFSALEGSDVTSTDWEELEPEEPYFFFSPWEGRSDEYEAYWSATDAFYRYVSGIETQRDRLFVDFDREQLEDRMETFFSDQGVREPFRSTYDVEDSDSFPLRSRRDERTFDTDKLISFLYRAWDRRWIYYDRRLLARARWDVMHHMLAGDNLGLVVPRQVRQSFRHALVVENPVNRNVLDTAARFGNGKIFPLYLYEEDNLFGNAEYDEGDPPRRPNLTTEFLEHVGEQTDLEMLADGQGNLEETAGPEDVMAYLYALLHSSTYRARYKEQLRIDYPRLPVTDRRELWCEMARIGWELIDLHLLRFGGRGRLRTNYPVPGSNEVTPGFPRYIPPGGEGPDGERTAEGRVYLNDGFDGRHQPQYVAGVEPEVWSRQIGGYQILERWLSDRRGRALEHGELTHYEKLVVALAETPDLMERVDDAIEDTGGWPIA